MRPHLTSAIVFSLLVLIDPLTASAAAPEKQLLWPEGAPGAIGSEEKDQPAIIPYFVTNENNSKAAVVVCPGGGYGGLAMEHEGHQIAEWLNSLGVSAFILDYRHRNKGYGHPAPLLDVQRAIRTVRANADEWKIDSRRIGVLGFSAGGHLASTVATHFDNGNPESGDRIEQAGCRPDFAILCYPVIAFDEPFTHRGSQRNLLGDEAPKSLVVSLSNEKVVSPSTPPTFLFHTNEDKGVPPENSIAFYMALRKAGVPAELHIYEKGRHGLGLAQGITGTEQWSDACAAWLRNRGIISDGTTD